MKTQYDVIVIGGGPGGYEPALHAAKLGLRTALIEKDTLGGTCLNRGCVPTKALLHAAELKRNTQAAASWGIGIHHTTLDFTALQSRVREVILYLRSGIAKQLNALNVEVISGTGQLINANTIRVTEASGTRELAAVRGILLAPGAKPATLQVPGALLPGVLDSDALLEAEHLPEALLIVGGGVIGAEFAAAFSGLGASVTLLEAQERLLPDMDRDIGLNLAAILKKRDVKVHVSATVQAFKGLNSKKPRGIRCEYIPNNAEETAEIIADAALVCVGRRPCADEVLTPGCGLAAEHNAIPVDGRGRTALPGVWAAGDITGGVQLAHYAAAQGIVAVDDIAGLQPSMLLDTVPYCVYTDPEIACVGITVEQAKKQNRQIHAGRCVLGGNARTLIADAERSFIKLVADAENEALLGAQLMCPRASDMIGQFSDAIAHGITLTELRQVMRAHPTFYEAAEGAIDSAIGAAKKLL